MDKYETSFTPLVKKLERAERATFFVGAVVFLMALCLAGIAIYNLGYSDGARETRVEQDNIKAGFTDCISHLKRRAK